ncbi:conidial yellow pigment biosynthesis polyketide synthase [Apiospora kogelbergensis]|uniref:Conidial yellow pigment biosynthesis polyketide synthase n=1 Tax=Apiospora kogelbergensis TaxID=1337665 RepID=A0AAW0QKB5_9PEZI
MTVASTTTTAPTILLFGGYTEPWLDSIDRIHEQAGSCDWLRRFLDDVASIVRTETRCMYPKIRNSLGPSGIFSSVQEVADKYRDRDDDVGGLINAAVLAISHDFKSLYEASVVTAGFVCRLCEVAGQVSRAVEEERSDGASWGCAVIGATPNQLDAILHQIQESKRVPNLKRARVGIRGDHWGTVIGPPSVLDMCLEHAAMTDLDQQRLPIYSMQHNYSLGQSHREYIAGRSALHSRPVHPSFRLWGLQDTKGDSPPPSYANWGELLLSVVDSAFSKPVDLVDMVKGLSTRLGSDCGQIELKMMGPTWFASALTSKLKAMGKRVAAVEHTVLGTDSLGGSSDPTSSTYEGRIAIVGMAARAPECDDLEQYWQVISTGRDLAREIPPGRFDADALFQPAAAAHQCVSTCKLGCFLAHPGHYDARFFRVSPREAQLMDPGSRLFQMAAHEALESAGYSCGATRATDPARVGVLFGQSNVDGYEAAHHEKGCDAYTLQALARPFAAGRHRPGVLDELVGDASGVRGAAGGEYDMMVAGTANVLASPHGWCLLSKAGVLSDTGNCKTFRDDAQGYCRGEFVGVVVLKRLEDAVAHNDRILAVIPGSARNQAGNSTFLTASDAGAEERVLREALRRGAACAEGHCVRRDARDGDSSGGPVRDDGRCQRPGSQASEASSGIASVIKAILMFQKHTMPPQVGMPHALNKSFPLLEAKKIRILSKAVPFNAVKGKPRRVLINNFDAAGGNTALVLEDFEKRGVKGTNDNKQADARSSHVVVLSAHTAVSHQANKSRLAKWLSENPAAPLADIAYTTTARRVHQPSFRFACAVSSTEELAQALESGLQKSPSQSITLKSPVIFVFTGQGSHYQGMGAELYQTSPVFRDMVDLCVQICQQFGFPSFLDIITTASSEQADVNSESRWNTAQTQLAVLSLEISLAAFWRRLGIEPALVMGHSLGEYAALHAAGVLSLADTLYLVGSRAQLAMQKCNQAGGACAMLAVAAPTESLRDLLKNLGLHDDSCSVACINSPKTSVLSGIVTAVTKVQAALKDQKIRTKMLPLPFGFHSFQVDTIVEDFVSLASGPGITFSKPTIPVASTLLASVIDSETPAGKGFGPGYLAKQARNPVDFIGALYAVRQWASTKFKDAASPVWLEIGPAQVCGSFVQDTLSPPAGHIVSSLPAATSKSPWATISECLASLYVHGCDPDWLLLHAPFEQSLNLLTLPSYAWDAKDFWITYREKKAPESDVRSVAAAPAQPISTCAQYVVDKTFDKKGKPRVILGASLALPGLLAMIEGHRMQGVGLCPGSVFCEAAFVAAKCALEHSGRKDSFRVEQASLRNAHLRRPLTASLVGPDGELHTTAVVESAGVVSVSFEAVSRSPPRSFDLGNCTVVVGDGSSKSRDSDAFYIRARMNEVARASRSRLPAALFYSLFARAVQYGSDRYRCLREVVVSDDFSEGVAEVVPAADPADARFVAASPYAGEALAHLAGFLVNCNPARSPAAAAADGQAAATSFVMDSLERFELMVPVVEPGRSYFTYARVAEREADSAVCEVVVFDGEDRVVMRTWRMRFHEVPNSVLQGLLPGQTKKSSSVSLPPVPVSSTPEVSTRDAVFVSGATENNTRVSPSTNLDEEHNDDTQQPATTSRPQEVNLLPVILQSIAEETGLSGTHELTDDVGLADLGVDSIMAVEICARIKEKTGHQLSPLAILECPTIGQLSRKFGCPQQQEPVPARPIDDVVVDCHKEDVADPSVAFTPSGPPTPAPTPSPPPPSQPVPPAQPSLPVNPSEPLPKARIMLLQGRPRVSNKGRLYLTCDGAGSISNYIHLLKHQFSLPVYGIDSPFLRCPSRLTPDVGIPGIARHMVEALLATQPQAGRSASDEDSIVIGGFSGGGVFCYEMARQLAEQGRRVAGLLILDMRAPLPAPADGEMPASDRDTWDVFFSTADESLAGQIQGSGAEANTVKHLRSVWESVLGYYPPRLAAAGSVFHIPAAVIWCAKGMIGRLKARRPDLVAKIQDLGYPIESYPGFMEDPKLGSVAWSLLNKRTEADLGPGGWDKFVGAGRDDGEMGKNLLCLAIDTDHHDVLRPPMASLAAELLDQGLKYVLGRKG